MGTTRKYAVIDPATGKLDRRIFSDQAVYDDEMEKIFGRAWLMIGHESLVPEPDDFFHTYMGEDPVILTRDGQGRLHALLEHVPPPRQPRRALRRRQRQALHVHLSRLDLPQRRRPRTRPGQVRGLLRRARQGVARAHRGARRDLCRIVFATWAKDAPSLEAYLGDARWYLDTVFNRRDGGMQALGPMKWLEPVNWKTLVDNCSDNYHVPTSHLSSARVQTRYLGPPAAVARGPVRAAPTSTPLSTGTRSPSATPMTTRRASCTACRRRRCSCSRSTTSATMPEVERRLGTLRARRVQLGNHSIFPNGILGLRLALPRGPLKTEFWHFVLVDRDAPEEIKRAIRIGSQANNGAAGMFEQDDVDNWRQVTDASTSRLGRQHPQDLSMGLGHAGPHPDYPGLVSERYISENNQRLFYRRWEEFMNAESWADIPLDPITARFDGTATMRG